MFSLRDEPINIGALLDFTGVVAGISALVSKEGLNFVFEQANYKVAGRPLELSRGRWKMILIYRLIRRRKLIEKDKVTVMIGPLMGGIRFRISALC